MSNSLSRDARRLVMGLVLIAVRFNITLAEAALAFLRSSRDVLHSIERSIPEVQQKTIDDESGAPAPAVPIEQSVTADRVVCLEDGKPFKTLKRHLRTAHNLTPREYRAKWGLSPDHPLVAPGYSKVRSKVAKRIGLGAVRTRRRERPKQSLSVAA